MDAKEGDNVPCDILPQLEDAFAVALPSTWSQIAKASSRKEASTGKGKAKPAPKPKADPEAKEQAGRGKGAPKKGSQSQQPTGRAKAKAKVALCAEASAGHIEIDWASLPEPPYPAASSSGAYHACSFQQVLNPTPLNPTPATCHKRKRKLRCRFRNAALQKLHCNIRFSAVPMSF